MKKLKQGLKSYTVIWGSHEIDVSAYNPVDAIERARLKCDSIISLVGLHIIQRGCPSQHIL
jgi:hypothetical protein